MATTIKGKYQGGLRNELTHVQSKNTIITDAPTDNKGKGEAFSPTDLVCGALAACMMTIMGITACEHGFDIDGTTYEVKKTMASDPRRIGQIDLVFNFPSREYTTKQQTMLWNAADTCPVAKSLHHDIIINISMNFQF
jgi:Predicted redox protein, regulator of disulfide bond formation